MALWRDFFIASISRWKPLGWYENHGAGQSNDLYKTEVIHRRAPWRTKAAVKLATLEWLSWFKRQRLLGWIGDIPPAEAEERYHRQLAASAAEPVLL